MPGLIHKYIGHVTELLLNVYKVSFDWLILGKRNSYIQVWAPDFLKSHFEAKRVGNYYYYYFL